MANTLEPNDCNNDSLDKNRHEELEKMCGNVLLWDMLSCSKHNVTIEEIKPDSIENKNNNIDFGTIFIDYDDIEYKSSTPREKQNDNWQSLDLEEPEINIDFLNEMPEEESNDLKNNKIHKKLIQIKNSNVVPIQLVKAMTLPRCLDEEGQEMFSAHIPAGGLLIEPNTTVEVEVICREKSVVEDDVGFKCRWRTLSTLMEAIDAIIEQHDENTLRQVVEAHSNPMLSTESLSKDKLMRKVKLIVSGNIAARANHPHIKTNGFVDSVRRRISDFVKRDSSALSYVETNNKTHFVIGRRCFATALSSTTQSLSPEAPKFIPQYLRTLFDTPPSSTAVMQTFEPLEVQKLISKIQCFPIQAEWRVKWDELSALTEHMLALNKSAQSSSDNLTNTSSLYGNDIEKSRHKIEEIKVLFNRIKVIETELFTWIHHAAIDHLGNHVRNYYLAKQSNKKKKTSRSYFGLFQGLSNNELLMNRFFHHLCQLSTMLLLEECQMYHETKSFDLFEQPITIIKQRLPDASPQSTEVVMCQLSLRVPGASEQRPSVRYGDVMKLRLASDGSQAEVHGRVMQVKEEIVTVRLPNEDQLCLINPNWYHAVQEATQTPSLSSSQDKDEYDYDKGGSGLVNSKSTHGKPLAKTPSSVRVHVRMQMSQTGFNLMHSAIKSFLNQYITGDGSSPMEKLLFPEFICSPNTAAHGVRKWTPINETLNESQQVAVDRILYHNNYLGPCLIFGPPGTGKTITLVEAVLQLLKQTSTQQKKRKNNKILVCAPSEAAANVLCDRLSSHLSVKQMYRLGWWQTSLASVPAKILKYTSAGEDGVILPMCPRHVEVVISTCAASGQLSLLGWKPGDFSHIIIDESCQALEPEVMIPLTLATPTTTVVLCGDPKQLGASIKSKLGRSVGYGKSLQERLMDDAMEAVEKKKSVKGDASSELSKKRLSDSTNLSLLSKHITLLDSNYRSHGDLLALPSKLFYESKLIEAADPAFTHSMLKWEKLPSPQPMLFYGIHGVSLAELDSPSYFNMIEASQIVELAKALLTSTSVSVRTSEIGVIAAFRQQVLRLRILLRKANMGNINVGQVEDFQGEECKVVIISTVIAGYDLIGRLRGHSCNTLPHEDVYHTNLNEKLNAEDDKLNAEEEDDDDEGYAETEEEKNRSPLGLLFAPKRFNVALTRARALVIVVGCPDALLEDKHWYKFLRKCAKQRSWYGAACPYLGIGLNGTNEEDGTDAQALLNHITKSSLLGGGATDSIYPTDLASMYDHEQQQRLIL